MKRSALIGIGIAVVITIVLAIVLNKSRWMRLTHAKWNMRKWSTEFGQWAITGYDLANPGKYKLADLIAAYYNGKPGWYLVGTEPPPDQSDASVETPTT